MQDGGVRASARPCCSRSSRRPPWADLLKFDEIDALARAGLWSATARPAAPLHAHVGPVAARSCGGWLPITSCAIHPRCRPPRCCARPWLRRIASQAPARPHPHPAAHGRRAAPGSSKSDGKGARLRMTIGTTAQPGRSAGATSFRRSRTRSRSPGNYQIRTSSPLGRSGRSHARIAHDRSAPGAGAPGVPQSRLGGD